MNNPLDFLDLLIPESMEDSHIMRLGLRSYSGTRFSEISREDLRQFLLREILKVDESDSLDSIWKGRAANLTGIALVPLFELRDYHGVKITYRRIISSISFNQLVAISSDSRISIDSSNIIKGYLHDLPGYGSSEDHARQMHGFSSMQLIEFMSDIANIASTQLKAVIAEKIDSEQGVKEIIEINKIENYMDMRDMIILLKNEGVSSEKLLNLCGISGKRHVIMHDLGL